MDSTVFKEKRSHEGINFVVSGELAQENYNFYVSFNINDIKTMGAIKNKSQVIFEILQESLNESKYYNFVIFFMSLSSYESDYTNEGIFDFLGNGNDALDLANEIIEKTKQFYHEHEIPEWLQKKVFNYCEQAKQFKQKKINRQIKDFLITERRKEFQSQRKDLMLALINRDDYKCVKCHTNDNLSIDHIMPLSKGGSDEPENLQFLCRSCNSKKSDNL